VARPELRAFHRSLEALSLVDPERDRIEKLDLVDLLAGAVRYAATSAPDLERAREIGRALEERTAGRLRHGVRLAPDDRAQRLRELGAPSFVARAIARRPAPLPLAFSWRPRTRAPAARPARLSIGPLLGYPPCCVRFEEARRARIVLAEAQGMVETWGARTEGQLLRGIDERRPFLFDEAAADEDGRVRRLRRFPFVSWVPCESCCADDKSPSGRADARRRELARSLDPGLVRAVERVRGARSSTR
jgi:hypothetical protein